MEIVPQSENPASYVELSPGVVTSFELTSNQVRLDFSEKCLPCGRYVMTALDTDDRLDIELLEACTATDQNEQAVLPVLLERKSRFTSRLRRGEYIASLIPDETGKFFVRHGEAPKLRNIRTVGTSKPEGKSHKKEVIAISVGAATITVGSLIVHRLYRRHHN